MFSDSKTTKYNFTEVGNAKRLVKLFGDDIRFCQKLKSWFVWNGNRWIVGEN